MFITEQFQIICLRLLTQITTIKKNVHLIFIFIIVELQFCEQFNVVFEFVFPAPTKIFLRNSCSKLYACL